MKRRPSNPVDELVFQCKAAGLPEPMREARLIEGRRWRFDLTFGGANSREGSSLIVEVEGGVYLPGGSRHTRGRGFEADCEKYAAAAIEGYRLIRVTPRHIREGKALAWIEELLK